jgi:single-strand DNA-binding protein
MLAVTGEIQTRAYTDKNGNNRTATEVVIENAYFAGSKKQDQAAPAQQSAPVAGGYEFPDGDDLPF